jgi:hypothetical protein
MWEDPRGAEILDLKLSVMHTIERSRLRNYFTYIQKEEQEEGS